jgi:cytochrome c-type biogenesis protein CcmH/NrfG
LPIQTGPSACPPERQWDELATGLVRGDQAAALLDHASTCDQCADLLRASLEIFQSESPGSEASTPVAEVPRKAPARRRWMPLAIAAMILAAIGTAFLLYSRLQRDPLTQLARIYSQSRSIELRIPGAGYGALRIERGSSKSLVEQPEEMLQAAARIRRELARNSRDPLWLHAKGRLALLEWQPEEALQALQESEDLSGPSATLLIDLAIAYYEKGQRGRDPNAWNNALDLLGRALQTDPKNPAALFNRALVLEQLHQTQAAIEDLEKLLTIEPSGPWSEESRRILARVRAKHQSFFQRPAEEDAMRFDEVQLDRLLLSASLPQEFARNWQSTHGDPWLADLQAASPQNRATVQALAQIVVIRLAVERGRYERERAVFTQLEHLNLAPPLALWLEFEVLYRATHARGEFACPSHPDRLLADLKKRSYTWLLVQSLREQAYCSFQRGDLEAAERYARLSAALAQNSAFPVAAIRTEAIFAHIAIRRGRFRDAFRRAQTALGAVAQQRLPVARSHEFLNLSMLISQSNKQWNSARLFAKGMTEAARIAGFRDLRFTNTVAWAEMSLRCGDNSEAQTLFQQALDFYKGLAPSDDRVWAEIGLADASGDESRLAEFGLEIEGSADALLWVPYQRVRAKLALDRGRVNEARQRVDRLEKWMESASPAESLRWQSEFRAAAQINLDLLAKEGRIQDSFAALQRWRRTEAPLSISRETPPLKLASAAIFSYASVGSRMAAWRRDGSQTDFRWLPLAKPQVEQLVRHFQHLLRSPESALTEITEVGRQLDAALFGEWLPAVRKDQELLIQADDVLANLAFSALPGMSEPLGIEHAISLTRYSIPDELASSEVPLSGELLIVDASRAQPAWAADLPVLVSGEREIAGIERLNLQSVEVIRGEEVTAGLLRKRLPAARTLHFVGHAAVTENGAVLVLSSAGASDSLFDLGGAGVSMPRTVVLSACSTGLRTSDEVDVGDPESLAAAFLQKGSREVIASLWNVDSEATASLMMQFYANLNRGSDPGWALSQARRAVRESARYSHPYYWAAFDRFIRT